MGVWVGSGAAVNPTPHPNSPSKTYFAEHSLQGQGGRGQLGQGLRGLITSVGYFSEADGVCLVLWRTKR